MTEELVNRQLSWLQQINNSESHPRPLQVAGSLSPTKISYWREFDLEKKKTSDHRTIGTGELVFDIDSSKWKKVRKYAKKLLHAAENIDLPIYLFSTGGKGVHAHIFCDINMDSDLLKRAEARGCTAKDIRMYLWNWFLDQANISKDLRGVGKVMDIQRVNFSDGSKGALIRAVGGKKLHDGDKDPTFKTQITEERLDKARRLYEQDPEEVNMPEEIETWNVSPNIINDFLKRYIANNEEYEEREVEYEGDYMELPCIKKAMGGVREGRRNLVAKDLAVALRLSGYDKEDAKQALLEYRDNCESKSHSFKKSEVLGWLSWVYGKEHIYWNCGNMRKAGLCDKEECPLLQEERQEVMGLLKDEEMIIKIREDMERIGVKAEEENKLLMFLLFLTKDMDEQQHMFLTGDASAGKSYLLNNVSSYFGDSVNKYTRLTPTALDHLNTDLGGKILIVQESEGAEENSSIRPLLSGDQDGGGLKILVTGRDEMGNLESQEKRLKGMPVFATSSTRIDIEHQFSTRVWNISPDVSKEKIKTVVNYSKEKGMYPWEFEDQEPDPKIIQAVELLESQKPVVIPYLGDIDVDDEKVRVQRDIDKLKALIKSSAFLHQYQRPKVKLDDQEYIVATLQDLVTASSVGFSVLERSYSEIQDRLITPLDVAKQLSEKGERIMVNTVMNEMSDMGESKSQSTVRKYLNELVELGYLAKEKEKRKNHYKVLSIETHFINLAEPEDALTEENIQAWLDRISGNGYNPEFIYDDEIIGLEKFREKLAEVTIEPEEIVNKSSEEIYQGFDSDEEEINQKSPNREKPEKEDDDQQTLESHQSDNPEPYEVREKDKIEDGVCVKGFHKAGITHEFFDPNSESWQPICDAHVGEVGPDD